MMQSPKKIGVWARKHLIVYPLCYIRITDSLDIKIKLINKQALQIKAMSSLVNSQSFDITEENDFQLICQYIVSCTFFMEIEGKSVVCLEDRRRLGVRMSEDTLQSHACGCGCGCSTPVKRRFQRDVLQSCLHVYQQGGVNRLNVLLSSFLTGKSFQIQHFEHYTKRRVILNV